MGGRRGLRDHRVIIVSPGTETGKATESKGHGAGSGPPAATGLGKPTCIIRMHGTRVEDSRGRTIRGLEGGKSKSTQHASSSKADQPMHKYEVTQRSTLASANPGTAHVLFLVRNLSLKLRWCYEIEALTRTSSPLEPRAVVGWGGRLWETALGFRGPGKALPFRESSHCSVSAHSTARMCQSKMKKSKRGWETA